jgi:hypothetical protein
LGYFKVPQLKVIADLYFSRAFSALPISNSCFLDPREVTQPYIEVEHSAFQHHGYGSFPQHSHSEGIWHRVSTLLLLLAFSSLTILSMTGKAIEVLVGMPALTFTVHEGLICASSAFFKAAMSHNWQESEKRTVRLEEDEPDLFGIYLNWLYCRTLPTREHHWDYTEIFQLAKAYVLGDRLQDGDFTDCVIDAFIETFKGMVRRSEKNRRYPSAWIITYIYDHTSESSVLRRLLVDIYTYAGEHHWVAKCEPKDELPKAFLYSLAAAMFDIDKCTRSKAILNPVNLLATCHYHQHSLPEQCYKRRLPCVIGTDTNDQRKSIAEQNGNEDSDLEMLPTVPTKRAKKHKHDRAHGRVQDRSDVALLAARAYDLMNSRSDRAGVPHPE